MAGDVDIGPTVGHSPSPPFTSSLSRTAAARSDRTVAAREAT